MSEKTNIVEFRDSMERAMMKNFEDDGYLTPIVFFYTLDNPIIGAIPPEMLSTTEGKVDLSNYIKEMCLKPNVFAGGLIIEANGVRIDAEKTPEIAERLLNGDLSVGDLEDKEDFAIIIFSTPEKEEVHSFVVDCKNKKVLEKLDDSDAERIGGTFTNFFQWTQN